MEATPISFKELFTNSSYNIDKVVIPKIQRSYAQGRNDDRTKRTRKNFLNAIHAAIISGSGLTLDFVYGYNQKEEGSNNKSGTLIPLDGQQRLTTLFLMHWFAARLCQVADEECAFLHRFSYETRYSARDFCHQLVSFKPDFNGKLSDEITDQPWFPLDWHHDATVESMLVMLDAINDSFSKVPCLWEALDSIKFYFLPIAELGQTDDIYIKMNSRGKPLTDFEHFKAEFEKALYAIDSTLAERVIRKIDIDWTNMLWPYRGMVGKDPKSCTPEDYIIDDEFLRYFRYVCDILCYRSGGSPKHGQDEFALIDLYFKGSEAYKNVETLEQFFDCWTDKANATLFDQFISHRHEPGKIRLVHSYDHNFFFDCLHNNAGVQGNGNRRFTLNQIILLYCFIQYILHRDSITESDFGRRLRIVYNLILNSRDEISDSENRTGGNRMPAILKQVDSIILDGIISDNIVVGEDAERNNFNANQLAEERRKLDFTTQHPEWAEELFKLEDHDLLQGQISIVGLEHPERFARFTRLFECDWDLVDCAMLATGNYWRRDRWWRIQLGSSCRNMRNDYSSAWHNLFDKSFKADGYERTKEVLAQMLQHTDISNNLLTGIKDGYLAACEALGRYEWKYYYIKYDSFRLGRYGKYDQKEDTPYNLTAMYTQHTVSSNSRQTFLAEMGEVDSGYYGSRITVDGVGYIKAANSAFEVYNTTDELIDTVDVPQTDGIDTTDRIKFGKEQLAKYLHAASIDPESDA